MASIVERKSKKTNYYYLAEGQRINGKTKVDFTYLGTKPPIARSRGWKNLSPEIVNWLKERAKQKTKPVKTLAKQNGKYRTIVVDPPWEMGRTNMMIHKETLPFDYPTMTLSQIKNDRKLLPIRKLINKQGCLLFLWTTQKYLPAAYGVLETWGFKYLFTMVWDKKAGMQIQYFPQFNCEFVLVGKRGDINFLSTKDFRTLFDGNRRKHSQKPLEFYQILKRVAPAPRIDMFNREYHLGFDQWGNEVGKLNEHT